MHIWPDSSWDNETYLERLGAINVNKNLCPFRALLRTPKDSFWTFDGYLHAEVSLPPHTGIVPESENQRCLLYRDGGVLNCQGKNSLYNDYKIQPVSNILHNINISKGRMKIKSIRQIEKGWIVHFFNMADKSFYNKIWSVKSLTQQRLSYSQFSHSSGAYSSVWEIQTSRPQ